MSPELWVITHPVDSLHSSIVCHLPLEVWKGDDQGLTSNATHVIHAHHFMLD